MLRTVRVRRSKYSLLLLLLLLLLFYAHSILNKTAVFYLVTLSTMTVTAFLSTTSGEHCVQRNFHMLVVFRKELHSMEKQLTAQWIKLMNWYKNAHGTSESDLRNPERQADGVRFISFPKRRHNRWKWFSWNKACGRPQEQCKQARLQLSSLRLYEG